MKLISQILFVTLTLSANLALTQDLSPVVDGRKRKMSIKNDDVAAAISADLKSSDERPGPTEITISPRKNIGSATPDNEFKSMSEIRAHTQCLLKKHPDRVDKYKTDYERQIIGAGNTFGVYGGLMSCTCSRESMYNTEAVSPTSVGGLCQITGILVKDTNARLNKDPALAKKFETYVKENAPECMDVVKASSFVDPKTKQRVYDLTRQGVNGCPGLNFAFAGMYMGRMMKTMELKRAIAGEGGRGSNLDDFARIAGAYNVGDALTFETFSKIPYDHWDKGFALDFCKTKGSTEDKVKKLKEVRMQRIAVRNCMQAQNNRSHQNKEMSTGAEMCGAPTPSDVADNASTFQLSLPPSCNPKQIEAFYDRSGPASANPADQAQGLDGAGG